MKQVEVTTYVNQSIDEVDSILRKQGFNIIRKSRVEDTYMGLDVCDLNKSNILDKLKKCILIRYLCTDGQDEFKKITYKKKEYCNDIVITEEKINLNIDDIDTAKKLFKELGFDVLVNVNYDVIVYNKDEVELAFQQVEDLGLLLEYESLIDYTDYSNEEILNIKKRLLDRIRSYGISTSDDFDVKKAYQLIHKKI